MRGALVEMYAEFELGKAQLRQGRDVVDLEDGNLELIRRECEVDARRVKFNQFQLGDAVLAAYGEALPKMVAQGVVVEELQLANNAATSAGFLPIARAVRQCYDLRAIDFSQNAFLADTRVTQRADLPSVELPPLMRNGLSKEELMVALRTSVSRARARRPPTGEQPWRPGRPKEEDDPSTLHAGPAAMALVESIRWHGSLETLRLSKTELGTRTGVELMRALQGHPSVTSLDVSHNRLGGAALVGAAAAMLAENDVLQELRMGWNNLGGPCMREFFDAVRHNASLVCLDLSWNSLRDDGAAMLASMLRRRRLVLPSPSCWGAYLLPRGPAP